MRRAAAEVAGDRLRPLAGVFLDEGLEPVEEVDALGSRRKRLAGEGFAVAGEQGVEVVGQGEEAGAGR